MPNDSLSQPNRANWAIYRRGQSNGLYALALVDTAFTTVADGSQSLNAAAFFSANTLGQVNEFIFDVNPKTMDLEEPAAVQIVPTQDGGQFIEHQGQIYKTITLTGTMGLRPNKRGTNLIPVLGVTNPFAANLVNQATGVPEGEETGFDRLLALRNLFRRYFDAKADSTIAHKVVMVWQNGKEGEFYVVEPHVFKTKRDASSPLTYQYEVQLQTIGRVDFKQFQIPDDRAQLNGLQRFHERINTFSRIISSSLATINALADRTVGVGQATITAILGPARAVLDGLTNITTTATSAFAVPRNSVALLATNCLEYSEALTQFEGESNAYTTQGILTQWAVVKKSILSIGRAAASIVSEDTLYSQPTSQKFTTRGLAYREPTTGRPTRSAGNPTNINNSAPGGGTALATIMGHDNIYSLSQRLLGNQARWKDLVVLNDLKAPYVDPSGDGKNVLRPGDKILVPVAGNNVPSGVSQSKTQEVDALVARLGRDLRLRSDAAAGGLNVFDLMVSNKGDCADIEGIPNLEQAIEIKFSTEQGELPTHPGFGIRAPIGSKALVRTLVGFQMNARASLLADSRISAVRNFGFRLDGNTVQISAFLQIADVDQSVSVAFDARR